ncbi:MAG TPA: D-Ala-D-Ala carboxypeptidase family metallohydrolase [bacterium]|nr:D-Ala-D-Ala carboxypeptidase family metallohydrolase [bacterium]
MIIKIIAIVNTDGVEMPCDISISGEAWASKNFRWRELADRSTLTLKYCPQLLDIAQWVRSNTGWLVDTTQGLSWYRTKETNERIGGVPNSRHTRGLAFDCKCWVDYVGGEQVHPIHVAYKFQEAFRVHSLKGGIGTYMPLYNGSSGGYNHIDIRSEDILYVCHTINELKSIKYLSDIKL